MGVTTSTTRVGEAFGADHIAYLSAMELSDAYRRRALSPVEIADALLARVRASDGAVNSVVHLRPDETLAMARGSEARYRAGSPLSPLDGVPATIKDLSSIAEWPRWRGSLALKDAPASAEDTPCVARLREAGVVFLAKTATPEAGSKISTTSAVHGVTRNPYDLARTPGGSSGGAAAALAMGYGPLAVGSDGAGSIRIPAAFTNCFGLKPGFGRVPAFPPDIDMPHSVVGPMTRAVADAAAMLAIMSRPEPRDPFGWPVPFVSPTDLDQPRLSNLRIAVSRHLGCNAPLVDPEIGAIVMNGLAPLTDAGAEIIPDDPKWPIDPFIPFKVFWQCAYATTVESFPRDRRMLLDSALLCAAEQGFALDGAAYRRAVAQRLELSVSAKAFFDRYDLLVGPVMPVRPWAADRAVPEGVADDDWRWCPYTYPWNMTGQPAASMPVGFTTSGLPVGMQIIGRMGNEADILRAAAAIESRMRMGGRRPPPESFVAMPTASHNQ